jgi:hypothetical protein
MPDMFLTHFPNASWYIGVDDDTFVFKESLANFLAQHDPNEPLMFGTARGQGAFEIK